MPETYRLSPNVIRQSFVALHHHLPSINVVSRIPGGKIPRYTLNERETVPMRVPDSIPGFIELVFRQPCSVCESPAVLGLDPMFDTA